MQERGRPDLATFLSLFEHKAREHSKLNRQEVHAITAFLTGRVPEFAMFEGAQSQLRQLLVQSTVVDEDDSSDDGSASADWSVDSGELINRIRDVCTRPAAHLGFELSLDIVHVHDACAWADVWQVMQGG